MSMNGSDDDDDNDVGCTLFVSILLIYIVSNMCSVVWVVASVMFDLIANIVSEVRINENICYKTAAAATTTILQRLMCYSE